MLPAAILIIDAHHDTLAITSWLLERSGFQTLGIRTCANALAGAERHVAVLMSSPSGRGRWKR